MACKVKHCHLCGKAAHVIGPTNPDLYEIECQCCGKFSITYELLLNTLDVNNTQEEDIRLFHYLPAHTRQSTERGNVALLDTDNWRDVARVHAGMSVSQKINKLLELIDTRSSSIEKAVRIETNFDYPLVDAVSVDEIENILDYLTKHNYIECVREIIHVYHTSITIEGLTYLEQCRRAEMSVPSGVSMEIAAKFQRVLRNRDFSEVDTITLDELIFAKDDLYLDRNMDYYQLLLHKISEKERKKNVRGTVFNISSHAIGILNTGEIEDVKSISVNISFLNEEGHVEIATALENLTQAVIASKEISTEQKEQAVELLEALSEQAALSDAPFAQMWSCIEDGAKLWV